jgi:hypothetical protein
LDTDNDSVFMNETVRDYCQQVGIKFTRCRPYCKNDQAWVEHEEWRCGAPDDQLSAASRAWKPRRRWHDCVICRRFGE